jgi:hypothetical protein
MDKHGWEQEISREAANSYRTLFERCPHGYHVTEGRCPVCDLDKNGKCGPYCQHDH